LGPAPFVNRGARWPEIQRPYLLPLDEQIKLLSGSGGIRGPDLTNVGERLTADQITTRIYSGAENMPSYVNNLTPEQHGSLVAFLSSRSSHFPH